jgi:hypothetical protein
MTRDQNEGITGKAKPIKVFISYSHDSEKHKSRVKKLAKKLKRNGISYILDQDLDNDSTKKGWASWSDEKILEADYIFIVCTEGYYRKIWGEIKKGEIKKDVGRGVKWEFDLIRKLTYNDDSQYHRLIPVLFSISDKKYIPERLIDLSYYCLDSEAGYEKMFERITIPIRRDVIDKELTIKPEGELHPKITKKEEGEKAEKPEIKSYPKREKKYKYLAYISGIIFAAMAAFIILKFAIPNWQYQNLLSAAGEYIKKVDYPKAVETLEKAKKNRGRNTGEITALYKQIEEKQIKAMRDDFESLNKSLAGEATNEEKIKKCRKFLSRHQNTPGNEDIQAMRDKINRFITKLNTDIKAGGQYQKYIDAVNNLIKSEDYEKAEKELNNARKIKDSDEVKRLYATITQGIEKERGNGEKEYKTIKDKVTLSQYQAFQRNYPLSPYLQDLRDKLKIADKNLPPDKYWDKPIVKNEKGYYEITFGSEHNGHQMIYIREKEFWIDKYEVSWAQYREFLKGAKSTSSSINNGSEYPAVATFEEAIKYCEKYGLLLPVAVEWEYAASGGKNILYPWGDENPDKNGIWRANYDTQADFIEKDGYEDTAPVKSFEKFSSPFGIVNMSGNVWEWIQGQFLKGGGYSSKEDYLKIAKGIAGEKSDKEGFRCIKIER